MKHLASRSVVLFLLLVPAALSFADAAAVALQADQLDNQGRYAEARSLLLDSVSGVPDGPGQAELYWRAARQQ